MSCDAATSRALVEALFHADSMGLCLFDAEGVVRSVEGAAAIWAPPVGAPLEEAPVFVGLLDDIRALAKTGKPLLLSGVSMGDASGHALDLRIMWVAELSLFAAVSNTATERNQLQFEASQIVRENRLLEQKVRQQQEKIAEQAALMELFIRNAPAAVAMVDSNLELIMLSQRWIEDFGDPALADDSEVAGSPLRIPQIDAALRLAMDTGVTSSRVERITQRGEVRWKRWEQTPWRRADRSVGGSIVFVEDVSAKVRASTDLKAQTEELDRLNAAVRSFGRGITTDMRAPMLRIDALAREILPDAAAMPKAARDKLVRLQGSVEEIGGMMDALQRFIDLLSRPVALAPVDIGDAVQIAADSLSDDIRATGARLVLHPTLVVSGDLVLLARVFRLLIDNALRHGLASAIVVDCIEEDGCVTVRVADDGPGVPAHMHGRVFEPFARLGSPPPGCYGMGLTECRKILELHGGSVSIDADYEAGLRLLLNLPHVSRGA